MTKCTINLPFPPSVNAMYRNLSGVGRVKTKKYKDWATEAGLLLNRQGVQPFNGPVRITYYFGPKPGRYDLSNFVKAVEDLLVIHGVVEDDNARIIPEFGVSQCSKVDGVSVKIESLMEDAK